MLDVVYYYSDQLTADLMVAIQAYLADVGVQMTYRKLEGDIGGQLNALPEEGLDTARSPGTSPTAQKLPLRCTNITTATKAARAPTRRARRSGMS